MPLDKLAPAAYHFPEQGSIDTPATGYVALAAKTDGKLYSKDDTGTETELGGGGSAAPNDATYIVQTANGTLTNEQALDALGNGILKHSSGVVAQAVANTDYAAATHAGRHLTGGADEIDGDKLDIDWTPSNYTPATTPTEADNVDNLTAHLYGIDQILATIGLTIVQTEGGYAPGSNYTTNSNIYVDVDATNVAPNVTLNGGGITIVTFSFRASKAVAGEAGFRVSDGTNHRGDQILLQTAAPDYMTLVGLFNNLSSGSTTFTLQYKSNDANNAVVGGTGNERIEWTVMELS